METISQRTMRNESGEILRRVEAGETFLVTNDGKPVGVLSPYVEDTKERLRREGRLTGTGRLNLDGWVAVELATSSEELLAEDRRR